jgi:hypothetical protein
MILELIELHGLDPNEETFAATSLRFALGSALL